MRSILLLVCMGFSLAVVAQDSLNKADTVITSSELIFCGGVHSKKPTGVSDYFYNNIGAGYFYAFFEEDRPFDFKQIRVEVYHSPVPETETWTPVDTMSYQIRPTWKQAYFRCNFKEAGFYKLHVYNEFDRKLAEGSIEVRQKK